MSSYPSRPIGIWLAVAVLTIELALSTWTMVRLSQYLLATGTDGLVNLLGALAFSAMIVATIVGLLKRTSWARRLAIICFVLNAVFAFFAITTLLNWPDKNTNQWILAVSYSVVRMGLSFVFAVALGTSRSMHHYFTFREEAARSTPPPPPTFDD